MENRGRRILVADDNEDTAKGLAALLEMQGHEVRVVHDGHAALEAFKEFTPDVAFLDVGMPFFDGCEVAAKVREEARSPVLLVAVTGWGHASAKQRAFDSGFDRLFVKPADPQELLALANGPLPERTH